MILKKRKNFLHVSFISLHFAKLCVKIFDYQFLAEFRKVSQKKKCQLLLSNYETCKKIV